MGNFLQGIKDIFISGILKELVLEIGYINEEVIIDICKLKDLRTLIIDDCYNDKISDTVLTNLSILTSLEKLSILHCNNITDLGFSHYTNLISLRDLDLSYCCNLSDTGLFLHQ